MVHVNMRLPYTSIVEHSSQLPVRARRVGLLRLRSWDVPQSSPTQNIPLTEFVTNQVLRRLKITSWYLKGKAKNENCNAQPRRHNKWLLSRRRQTLPHGRVLVKTWSGPSFAVPLDAICCSHQTPMSKRWQRLLERRPERLHPWQQKLSATDGYSPFPGSF